MTTTQSILTIMIVVFATVLTRAIPFILFPSTKTPPSYIRYLGMVLPYAVIGLLIVYCLKDSFTNWNQLLPSVLAIGFIVALHNWKQNTLLSIGLGTIFYMFLIQVIF